jgi:ribosomal protein S18 acetylase RimI-like enzyme
VTAAPLLSAVRAEDEASVADARTLLLEYVESLGVDLSFQNFDQELSDFPLPYLPPTGALLIARCDGQLAGSIALRGYDAACCEMKRLYVRGNFRGLGVGGALADAIIGTARSMGYQCMRLDTLPGMDDAQRLYRSLGFKEIPAYYENPIAGTKYLELDLR